MFVFLVWIIYEQVMIAALDCSRDDLALVSERPQLFIQLLHFLHGRYFLYSSYIFLMADVSTCRLNININMLQFSDWPFKKSQRFCCHYILLAFEQQ